LLKAEAQKTQESWPIPEQKFCSVHPLQLERGHMGLSEVSKFMLS
jgi:hypothetical protein